MLSRSVLTKYNELREKNVTKAFLSMITYI